MSKLILKLAKVIRVFVVTIEHKVFESLVNKLCSEIYFLKFNYTL